MNVRLAWLLIALLFAVTACKKPAQPEIHPEYGEVLAKFYGELTDDDIRRNEDNSPVDYHDIDLVEGQNVYVRMEALTPFSTFLLIATPNRTGGYINNNCMPGENEASCMRFTADQTGTYRLMANGAVEESRGKYVLWVFQETDEEAAERMEAHRRDFKIAVERRKQAKVEAFEKKVQELLLEHENQKKAESDNTAEPDAENADKPDTTGEASDN